MALINNLGIVYHQYCSSSTMSEMDGCEERPNGVDPLMEVAMEEYLARAPTVIVIGMEDSTNGAENEYS